MANTLPPTCPASLGRSKPKSGRDLAEPQDVCLECLCFRVLAVMGENPRSGRPAVSPPRGPSIRRPTKSCQRRAGLISNWLCPITAGQSRHSFEHFDLECSFPYPFLSPAAWGSPEPSSKKSLSVSCWFILVDFCAFRTALKK